MRVQDSPLVAMLSITAAADCAVRRARVACARAVATSSSSRTTAPTTTPLPPHLRSLTQQRPRAFSTASSASPVPLFTHVIDGRNGGSSPTSSSSSFHPHPIVFIHGLLGSGTNFRTIQQRASKDGGGRYTVAVDLRNHGKTAHVDGPMTLEQLAADVAKVIEGIPAAAGRVDVVGHSLGGKTAMVLALTRPDLLRRLVVVDIAPVTYDTTDPNWRNVAKIVEAAHSLRPEQYRTRAEVDAKLAEAVTDPGVRSFVAQNLVPQPSGTYAWRINTAAILSSMRTFAAFPSGLQGSPRGGPAGPEEVHFVSGELSTYLRPGAHYDAARTLFPGAKVHVVKGSGHWVHAEKPKEFWEVLATSLGMAV